MSIRRQFTDEELAAIRAATQEAEEQTGGELVCVIVDRCDAYPSPMWQAMAMGALGGALAATVGFWYGSFWSPSPITWILAPPFLGAAVALLAVWLIQPLRRGLVASDVLDNRVSRRAAAAFLSEQIFDTRDRTGVLLFVALFEHQIRILTDRGLDDWIPEQDWQPIADRLTDDLRRGNRTQAIVRAIQEIGLLLIERGVARRTDDQNELDDEPRILDE